MSQIKQYFLALALTSALIGSAPAFADVEIDFLAGFTGPLISLAPRMYKGAKFSPR
jgi:hypothetical protein